MVLRRMRKSLKRRLRSHPIASRSYNAISWTFTRSRPAQTVKRSLGRTANALFPMWIEPRCRLAYRYASEGKVEKAVAIADDLLARKIDFFDPTIARLGAVYSLQGRYEEADRLFERMEERCYELACEYQYDRLGLRFFPSDMYSAIGHIGLLDKYIKAETLGIIPPSRARAARPVVPRCPRSRP